ncbi:putative esterase [Sphingobium herbicidovorans NBRC 16415]|uniref:Esterase n=1 Tax=Sphingobium herbicidovorans (strain ATCC 700291 / DSM 11019 / CCUG 56400 / KCTC 2939 / LMG 18315 / NBRC 16415 / MH) TaxID=1219045 RepID=A0A086PCB1_SPHHM|nr:alpha/beta hydrolase [Sphingobium herbicidovorans]KFG91029.1 putative esterase [Sphingobium herbicidovorans NBRC 16415]
MKQNPSAVGRRAVISGAASAALATFAARGSAEAAPPLAAEPKCDIARNLPPPTTISKAAQDYLRNGAMQPPKPIPAAADVAGWRAYVSDGDKALPVDMILKLPGIDVQTRQIGSATCYVATPLGISDADRRKAHLSIHGGGWVLFGGRAAMALAKVAAMQTGGVTYAVDYRMPPDHPFPAGLDDCFAVYRLLLKEYGARNILVSGGSAGGNLAAALMHKVKDAGLEKPSALVLQTPVTDLTNAGDSWQVLKGLDPVLRDPDGVATTELYLNGNDPRHPYLSPLFGDLAKAFPPTHLVTGTRDRLLSDTVRLHAALRAAGVEADLYVGEAMPHAGFGGLTPEDAAVAKDTQYWLKTHWPQS